MSRTTGSKTRPFPAHSLEQALVIIQGIVDKGAGQPMDRLLVAQAIGRTPSSSEYRRLLSSSVRYDLTTGTEKADYIAPNELGLRIAKPQDLEEKAKGLVEASLKPDLMGKVLRHFNKNKLPDTQFLKNTLEKTFKVDPSLSDELAGLLIENAKFCGILQNISGSSYIRIEDPTPPSEPGASEENSEPKPEGPVVDLNALQGSLSNEQLPSPDKPAEPDKPRKIFIAHGKNRKPVEALKKILEQFKIPYTVAVDEPHQGRPISKKVAQLMDDCSAGMFIFTKDERFLREDEEGNHEEVWRPSENLVYELGAASILWEQKIIILKENGVNFPSDFSDLGYITFEGDGIENKALDLLKELVALGLVKVQAA